LQRTTLAMNDAAGRLSRFFLVQTLVNASFGVIDRADIGHEPQQECDDAPKDRARTADEIEANGDAAAGFPVALAAALDPGWGIALETLALFIIVEPIIGQGVEPWLYGHNTGISPIDAPPLTPVENFYQRMLAGDASEVVDQAERFLQTNSLIDYYDEVTLPALLMAQVDLRRGVLDEPRQRRIKETIDEVIEDLSDHVDQPPAAAPAPGPFALENSGGPSPPTFAPSLSPSLAAIVEAPLPDLPRASRESEMPVLCIAGRSFLDESAAALFAQILEKHGMGATVGPAGALTVGRISRLSAEGVRLVCLSYFDADLSTAGARFAVRRLRRRLGEVKILAGFWESGPGQASELCGTTKADFCATRFKEALAICLHEAVEEATAEAGKGGAKPAV
jgi:hypothetical protein